MKRIIRNLIQAYLRHFPLKINQYWLFMNPQNVELALPIVRGQYERDNTLLFSKILKPGWRVVDVGAYIGYYSVHFAKLVGAKGEIFAFEPNTYSNRLLTRNIKLQNVKNVQINKMALGDRKRRASFYMNAPESSLIKENVDYIGVEEVAVTTLDEALKDQKVDFIKMDVQGYEYNILLGAKKVIANNPNLMWHIEFWLQGLIGAKCAPIKLLNFLKKSGYRIYIVGKGNKDYSNDLKKIIKITQESPMEFVDLICTKNKTLFKG